MKVFHFLTSMVRLQWFKFRGFQVIADDFVQGNRFMFCSHCEEYQNGMCRACGCLVGAKISLNSEACPKKYWPCVYTKKKSVLDD